ncbi:TPA_asm: bactoprenol glucosyl transferase, partial [Salmonella enterica subsp. enterica]|nr:bactoprenol glucosyl transferase [Salmonella enterica subsp. enterica]
MKISLVVLVFNEEDTIPIFYRTVHEFNELENIKLRL